MHAFRRRDTLHFPGGGRASLMTLEQVCLQPRSVDARARTEERRQHRRSKLPGLAIAPVGLHRRTPWRQAR